MGQFILYRTYLFVLLYEQNQILSLGANLLILF